MFSWKGWGMVLLTLPLMGGTPQNEEKSEEAHTILKIPQDGDNFSWVGRGVVKSHEIVRSYEISPQYMPLLPLYESFPRTTSKCRTIPKMKMTQKRETTLNHMARALGMGIFKCSPVVFFLKLKI